MDDIKISLTVNVPGGTRHFKGMKKVPYVITKQDCTTIKLPFKIGSKVVKKGYAKIPEYIYEDSQVHINMRKEAYNYMSSQEQPEKYYKKDWKRLKPEQRIAWHMQYIANSYNGTSYSYNILED